MPEQAFENSAPVAGLTRFISDQISIVDGISELKLPGDLAGGAIQHNFAIDVAIKSGTFAGHHRLVVRADAPGRPHGALHNIAGASIDCRRHTGQFIWYWNLRCVGLNSPRR